MSFLLPHFLREGRGRIDTYFSRVYNPVWTNPDGFAWLEVLTDESLVGCHVALTPTWSESAWFADYVLPMGNGAERHDLASYETHAGRWVGFRQPVLRVDAEREGRPVSRTWEANPGEVWEEQEFWIDLSWHIDPDGSLGIRQHFESIEHPGQPLGIDEYYDHLFRHSIPGLPEAAAAEGRTPLEYMRVHGAFAIPGDQLALHETPVPAEELARVGARRDDDGVHRVPGTAGLHGSLDEIHGHMPFIGDGSVGRRRRRGGAHRVPDAVAQAGAVLRRDARLGLARARHARLHQEPRPLGGPRLRRRRADPDPHVPHPDADPHPIGAGQVAGRDQPRPSDVDPPVGRRAARHPRRRAGADHDAHRPLRDPGVAHRRDPSGRRRRVAPHGPLAARRGRRHAALRVGADVDRRAGWRLRPERLGHGGRRGVDDAPRRRRPPVPLDRPRQRAGVVERPRRAPEPDVPRPAGPDLRDALLAAAGHRRAGRAGRPLRGRRRRHRTLAPGVPRVAGQGPPGSRSRRPAPPAVVRPARQAAGDGVPRPERGAASARRRTGRVPSRQLEDSCTQIRPWEGSRPDVRGRDGLVAGGNVGTFVQGIPAGAPEGGVR